MIQLFAIGILVILLYWYGTRNHSYWKQKGVKYYKTVPFIGSVSRMIAQRISMVDFFTEVYRSYPGEKYAGYYMFQDKVLVLRDPELIKRVLVTDFHAFYARGMNVHKVDDPMMKNLFMADGDVWKLLRQRMTPAFTSGKLKAMFPLIVEKAEGLKKMAVEAAESGKEVEMRDFMARFATDFIGTCGFGIDSDSMNDEDSSFRKLGKRLVTPQTKDSFRSIFKLMFPILSKFVKPMPPEIEYPILHLVKRIMKQRNYTPSSRNDFIDLLLELKQKGKIIGESIELKNPDGTPKASELELDDHLIASQVFIFFVAGFETSSSSTSYTLHQLAFHPEAQRKCQEEIDQVLSRYNNKLCYEAVGEMKYLKMAFSEGMRMFPPVGFLMRRSTQQYTFPGTDLTIDNDVCIVISVQGLQMDEKYFEDPDQFDPERFHPNNKHKIRNHVYMPFGEGPRACVGERLGFMQSLAGLAALLSEFTVIPSKNSLKVPITDASPGLIQNFKGGLPLILKARKKTV